MVRRVLAVAGLAAGVGCANLNQRSEEHETTGGPESAAMRYQQRLNRDGTMPENGIWKAKLRRDAMEAALGHSGSDVGWTWIGPGNVGGRCRSILIHPTSPTTMWTGSVGGGVWKTLDGGSNWFPLQDFVPALAIGCMAMDPNNPAIIFAGTGEGCFDVAEGTSNSTVPRGAGVFKSLDGGTSWVQVPATATADWFYVNRLAFQPGSSQVMLAATNSGIWRSTDGGTTWSQRTTHRVLDVEWDPTNNGKAVAGEVHGMAHYSLDGGITWLDATGIPGTAERVELTYAPSNTSIIYAGVAAGVGSTTMKIYRSLDAGQSYAVMTTSPANGVSTLSSYTGVVWVDPQNPVNLILGTQGLYRSTNSGATLTSFLSSIHADHHYIHPHPQYNGTTNKVLLFAGDGGMYRVTDWSIASPTSTNLNNNLGVTQFYGAAISNTSGVVIAGAQDNGTNRYTGTIQGWTLNVIGGDGGFCASDPTDPNFFYGESQRLAISRSSNGGASFGSSSFSSGISDRLSLNCNFIPYFMLDPNDPARMLACGRSLWRTNNAKTGNPPTWAAIKSPITFVPDPPGARPPPQDHYSPNDPRNIATVSVAEGNSDIIWVGHNNGQIWKTTNGTATLPTWTRVDGNAPAWPGRWVSKIVIDRNNHNRVYVAMLGYAADNVWRTIDAGASWQSLNQPGPFALPDVPVGGFAQHRQSPTRLYAGTEVGLFQSVDDGATWAPIAPEMGPVDINELNWRNNTTLMAVTFGRGVFLGDVSLPVCYPNCDSSTTAPILNVQDFSCFLNRFASGDTYANCDNSTTAPTLNVQDFSCFLNSFSNGCP